MTVAADIKGHDAMRVVAILAQYPEFEKMFYLTGAPMSTEAFDRLEPEIRKASMLKAIDNFLKYGRPIWEEVLYGIEPPPDPSESSEASDLD